MGKYCQFDHAKWNFIYCSVTIVVRLQKSKELKDGILDSYGSWDRYYATKRETERMKAEDAYDFFYGNREYR